MANWREKIDLNGVVSTMSDKHDLTLVEEECPAEVKTALATELEKSTALKYLGERIRKAKSIAAVQRILDTAYDVADQNLVWCGMPA